MGELADQWSAAGGKNLRGSVPVVLRLQSEPEAAGAVHGALHDLSISPEEYAYHENRLLELQQADPPRASGLLHESEQDNARHRSLYKQRASLPATSFLAPEHRHDGEHGG